MNPRSEAEQDDDDVVALLEECLLRMQVEGSHVVDELCRRHPAHAAALRDAVGFLRAQDMLESDDGDVPERLGEFRPLRRLGGGGMGVVFLAEQPSLGRHVALKLVRPELMFFAGSRARFRREAEAIARLQHPGIVPVFAVGEERGIPYFAMEYVAGASLAAIVAELAGRQPEQLGTADLRRALERAADSAPADELPFDGPWWRIAGELVLQVAAAVEHAHRRGVLHRDLKPSNVMLASDGRVQLVDFGLARSEGDAALTLSGTPLGSLAYMAPEQVEGRGEPGVATDVYGLGVLLYELLALRCPFLEETGGATRARILEGRAEPLRRLHRGLPPDVETVCLKAMAPEPERRYASAQAFAQDLAAALAHKAIVARRAGPWARVRRYARRHPARVALTVVLAVAVPAISILAGVHVASRDAIRRGEAVARAQRVDALLQLGWSTYLLDPDRARSAFDEVLGLEPDHPLAVLGRALVVLSDDPDAIGALLDAHPDVVARHPTFALLADAPWTDVGAPSPLPAPDEIPADAVDWFVVGALELQRANLGDDTAWDRASTCIDQAIDLSPTAQAVFHLRRSEAASMAGDVERLRRGAQAIEALWPGSAPALALVGHHLTGWDQPRARALVERATQLDPGLATAWLALGAVRRFDQDDTGALAAYERAVALAPGLALAHGELAAVRLVTGDLDGALVAIDAALALEDRDPDLHDTLGEVRAARGEDARALAAWARSIELAPELPWPWFKRGRLRLARGDAAEAVADLRAAAERGPDFALTFVLLADALVRSDDAAGARAAFERAVGLAPADPDLHARFVAFLERLGDADAADAERRRFSGR